MARVPYKEGRRSLKINKGGVQNKGGLFHETLVLGSILALRIKMHKAWLIGEGCTTTRRQQERILCILHLLRGSNRNADALALTLRRLDANQERMRVSLDDTCNMNSELIVVD